MQHGRGTWRLQPIQLGIIATALGLLSASSSRAPRGAAGIAPPVTKPHISTFRVSVPMGALTAIYGNTVAWGGTEQVPRPSHLYLADIRSFHPHSLTTSARGGQFNYIQLSANWIVWIEYSSGSFSWSIRVQNRHTERRFLIDSSAHDGIPANPLLFPLLSLSGNALAWTRISCARSCAQRWTSSVHLMELPAGKDQTIYSTQSPCQQTLPWLSARLLVWDEEGTCLGHVGTDVLRFDRLSGQVRSVTLNHRSSEPTTNGSWIAWKQVKHGQERDSRMLDGDIVLENVGTGRRAIVSAQHMCNDPQSGASSCATAPKLTDSVLAWQALDGDTVEALDLVSWHHYTLARPIEGKLYHTTPGLLGFGWGKRLIWTPRKMNERTSHGTQYLAVADLP